MWVKVDDRNIINVDQKVVKMVRTDSVWSGGTIYEIAFYNSLENGARPAYNYKWSTSNERDQAFNSICEQLEVIDLTRIKN